jgi:MFS family permease
MSQPRLFYGWIVVACAFVVMFTGFGVAYSFGAFFPALQQEFQANRGDISLIFSISGFLYFGLGAVSGTIADRVRPRWVIAGGMALIAIGLVLASRAETLWQIYLIYGLSIGLGVGFSYVPSIGAVQRWFVRRRGLASGIAVSGIGVGTLVMPFAAAALIAASDWRVTYLVFAGLAATLGLGTALLIDDSPARRGLLPDGEPATAAAANPATSPGPQHLEGATIGEAMGTWIFWALFISAGLTGFGIFIPFVHLANYARDHGLSEETGVLLIGLIGVGSVVGRFLLGGIADRFGRRRSYAGMFAGMGIMLVWWLGSTSAWALMLFALLFGTFYGGFVALAPALITDYFGGRNASGLIGLTYSSVAFGTLLGPTLAGFAYDFMQSYDLPIIASVVFNVAALALIGLLAEPEGAVRRS